MKKRYVQNYATFLQDYKWNSFIMFYKDIKYPYIMDEYSNSSDVLIFHEETKSYYKVPCFTVVLTVMATMPKFDIGDKVRIKSDKTDTISFIISSLKPTNGSFWYQSEWGDTQNVWDGAMEEKLEKVS